MNLYRILAITRISILTSIRSRVLLAISLALLILIALDFISLLVTVSNLGPVWGFTEELTGRVVSLYMAIITPILTLIIAAPSFSRERSAKTLRLILSQNLTNSEYFFGKLTGIGIVVVLPMVLASLTFLLLGVLFYRVPLIPFVTSRFVLSIANLFLLTMAYASIGALVSILSRSPTNGILVTSVLFTIIGPFNGIVINPIAHLLVGAGSDPAQLFFQLTARSLPSVLNMAQRIELFLPSGSFLQMQVQLIPPPTLAVNSLSSVDMTFFFYHSWGSLAILFGYTIISSSVALIYFAHTEK